jgi:hypothetical protein
LNYSETVYKTRKWYISHELLAFEVTNRGPRSKKATKMVVWENLILIRARNPEEAYRKALKHGRQNEEKVKIGGKDGQCRFKGLKDLVLVYDDLDDGSELEWHDLRLGMVELAKIVKRKRSMQAFNLGSDKR